ncbi:MAG TPA: alpha-galactosidase [Candidatus Hydrogenedentes bacterium]|nr:alpha-galactosidase [Candidatus Hydrogenedentota bacterium]HPG65994.1 alpha-galactosidase [Candidatus Hydrogenedentota bacterium]
MQHRWWSLGLTLLATMPSSNAESRSEEARQVAAWVEGLGWVCESDAPAATPAFRILEARQDYREPARDVCCHTFTPLRIGSRSFAKGIGAHANGLVAVALDAPCVRFTAQVGIDNNDDTRGERGSAVFVVHVDGQERFRSAVCRGGNEPISVDVDLTGGGRLDLIIEDAADGITYDQADWAEAAIENAQGERWYIGDSLAGAAGPVFADRPTAFTLDGQDCWTLFRNWRKEVGAVEDVDGGIRRVLTWAEPGTGFEATLTATVFNTPPAIEIQWRLSNAGNQPSALITDVRSIDLHASAHEGIAVLTSCRGGTTGTLAHEPGFEITKTVLGSRELTVGGGRSSDGDLPFCMLSGLGNGWGVTVGLGWSGAWRAEARFDREVAAAVLKAGMTPVRFRLPAGESVTLPSALLVPFKGAAETGSNRLRAILRQYYQGRLGGHAVAPPVSFSSWFVFDNRVNETMLRELADEAAGLGIEYFCLDAGWFEGEFSDGVGNWTIERTKFPAGLKVVADHVHALGMRFGLWFEPERVVDGTQWAQDHPDLLCGRGATPHAKAGTSNLLDLGNPAARDLVLSMMSSYIEEVGVDWIRYDFNISPGPIWQAVEGPDEQGLRQIRHINGLYSLWRELMRRHPNLLIEQCSSGGRRIDLETIRFGHTFWKSDDTRDQALMRFHETGGNVFLLAGHLNTNYCDYRSEGEMVALFAGPLGFGADYRALDADQKDSVRRAIAAFKQVRHYLNLDYYALFAQSASKEDWAGWEFIDPEAQEGCFILYRQEESRYCQTEVRIEGLSPERSYRLEELMSGQQATATGAELATTFAVTLPPGGGQVWRFSAQ